jgi:uncharacterized membrane protein HdeD (DUF308 family)
MQRIKGALIGLVMIIAGIIFFLNPTKSYPIITTILCLGLLFRGFQMLFFYFRMARYMVDGRNVLYRAIIMIDLGLFTGSLTQVPLVYVMLYLIAINLFSGGVDILRAMEAKKYGSSWKMTFISGIICVILAVACLIFIKATKLAVMIYALGVIYSGVVRIIQSFRKTAMVYIQ